ATLSQYLRDRRPASDDPHASLGAAVHRLRPPLPRAAALQANVLGQGPPAAIPLTERQGMKAKPPGSNYRNLTAYRGAVWFERVVRGRRFRVDLETTAWEEAAARRDAYEEAKGVAKARGPLGQVPTLRDFAGRYLAEDTAHLAPTTREERGKLL